MTTTSSTPVVIIGAGLAGLACARHLGQASVPCRILEASDGVGGRVRSDRVAGPGGEYLVDRGFQVYLSAYPEGQRVLDREPLRFRAFIPGALVRFEGRFWRAADPLRAPAAAIAMLRSPLVTRRDLVALGLLDARVRLGSERRVWRAPEETSEAFLRGAGLSDRVIERFFRPFFGGVFLDRSLRTSARKLRLTYRMFARGSAVLPAHGMQAIPEQLASGLAPDCLALSCPAQAVRSGEVEVEGGRVEKARAVVVATDGSTAHELVPGVAPPRWHRSTTISFAAPRAPAPEPILYLDGDGTGPANHVAVISNVQPSYAPAERALLSATIVAPTVAESLAPSPEEAVRAQLRAWFGPSADDWSHLRTDTIDRALPSEEPPVLAVPQRPIECGIPGVFVGGDHLDNASINGALESGRRVADAVIASIGDRSACQD